MALCSTYPRNLVCNNAHADPCTTKQNSALMPFRLNCMSDRICNIRIAGIFNTRFETVISYSKATLFQVCN